MLEIVRFFFRWWSEVKRERPIKKMNKNENNFDKTLCRACERMQFVRPQTVDDTD